MIEMQINPTGAVRPMTDAEHQAIERERSERLMRAHQEYARDAHEFTPTWAQSADDCHESVSSVAACELLAETATHDYWRGYFLGKAQLLRELQSLTGRPEYLTRCDA